MKAYYLPNAEYFLLVNKNQVKMPSPDEIEDRGYTKPVDWSKVAHLVSDLGKRLAEGQLGNGNWDTEGYGEFVIDASGLSEEEERIVAEWFGLGQAPRVDAKNSSIQNGRHRLNNCWTAEPNLALPVRCEFFMNVDEIEFTPSIEEYVKEDAEHILQNFDQKLKDSNPIFIQQVEKYLNGTYDMNREAKAKKTDK